MGLFSITRRFKIYDEQGKGVKIRIELLHSGIILQKSVDIWMEISVIYG